MSESATGTPIEASQQATAVIVDPWFYIVAVPAVLIFGISKGGFGGGLGILAVPMMALVISPMQAAAILLPILCLMDLVGAWAYRSQWLWRELRLLLPAAIAGLAIGFLFFEYLSPAIIRVLLGSIAVVFTLHYWLHKRFSGSAQKSLPAVAAYIAGIGGGITSFIAHSGGPMISMYLFRQNMDRKSFVATTVFFFLVMNYAKLLPYSWLGQFDPSNLKTSLVLAPLAPVGVYAGVWMTERVSDELFYRVAYTLLFFVGLRLLYDGVAGLSVPY